MKKRILSLLLCLVMVVSLLPTIASASETGEERKIYVSKTGNDEDEGTKKSPYASLTKAVEAAPDGATIYVMSDLEMTTCARFYDKSLTITSGENGPYTVTRGDKFDTLSDNARSWYNPAMIEVQNTDAALSVGLTLSSIIFDDNNTTEGRVFAQAVSGEENTYNTQYVQDAIIASNATVPCTITLSDGAVLRNFGGMSAVRVTNQAELVMESGSIIMDSISTITRIKGADGSVGPAGAVWIQGGSFEMKAGAKIQNINGRAVYADGGEVSIGGTISEITGNSSMWQGLNGIAVHLRNNATGTMAGTGLIEKVTGKNGNIVCLCSGIFTMDNGSLIDNHAGAAANSNTHGIYSVDSQPEDSRNTVHINGEIRRIDGNPLQIANTNVHIGNTGYIHDNFVYYGALYLQKNAKADIYGKINNNVASGRGGGIGTAGHGFVEINLYDGSEIKNNIAKNTGGGISLKNCKLTMLGGEISNNTSYELGGGIFLYEDASTMLSRGILRENTDKNGSGSLSITKKKNGDAANYLYISDECIIDEPPVYMELSKISVKADIGIRSFKLHNAHTSSVSALAAASNEKGWTSPLATFWTQRDGAAKLTVDGLTLNEDFPAYVLTLPVNADGTVVENAVAQVYAAEKISAGKVSFMLPDVSGNGCAVAVVQPTQDCGTLTISGPETIKKNKTGEGYPVTYTVTYEISENLQSILEQSKETPVYSLVVNSDSRLTGTPADFDGKSIMVEYTLPINSFKENDRLLSSAELTITVGNKTYIIPSNVVETQMVGLASFDVVFDYNDGSGKKDTVSVSEGDNLGDSMPDDPTRHGYIFTGWNTQQDGTGIAFDKSTPVTGVLTVYAQWLRIASSDGNITNYYYFAIEKADAKDGHALSGARFGLFLDGKQIASASSDRSGYAIFRVSESDYNKIGRNSELYYQELIAPEGYILSSTKNEIEKSDLYRNDRDNSVKNADTVYNYRKNVPVDLNGDNHVAYVHGYADGTVKPNNNITRAETATMLYRLLTDARRSEIYTVNNSFSDVSGDLWYNEAVSSMANGDYIVGYPDGTFGGDNVITRAEFVTMLVRFVGVKNENCSFSDVARDHWAYGYIATATKLDWIAGYPNGTFKPEQAITRAEAITILNRVLDRGIDEKSQLPNFKFWPDNDPLAWYYYEVIEATNEHEYTGSRPSENWVKILDH